MIFPRRDDATNKELILTLIDIQGYLSRYGKSHTNWHETLNEVIERLEQVEGEPQESKEVPQRMRGKWKGYNGEKPDWQRTDGSPVFLICSECGATVVNNFAAKWNYCCVCGADMRETE
jgi:hypothetical protein